MTTAEAVRVFAPAKINLFLHVGEKRDDGYHALQSLVVFVEAGDTLEFHDAPELSLSLKGPFAASLSAEDNLVLRAARAVDATARIVLTKNLPVASGIGGGSADAAAALRGLSRLPQDRLREIAATLGSDVPVCVASRSAWMEGRGEIVNLVAGVPSMPMLLVNPGVAVATSDVFRALKTRSGTGMPHLERVGDLLSLLHVTANDLEAPAVGLQPVIADVLREIAANGAVLARMSGSGATCFGLFESDIAAAEAARTIAAAHPSWWVCPTRIA